MGITPNLYDAARIERLLVSMNAKLGTMESILIRSDDDNREGWNNAEEESEREQLDEAVEKRKKLTK